MNCPKCGKKISFRSKKDLKFCPSCGADLASDADKKEEDVKEVDGKTEDVKAEDAKTEVAKAEDAKAEDTKAADEKQEKPEKPDSEASEPESSDAAEQDGSKSDQDEDEEEDVTEKRSKKPLIIAIVCILVIGLGAGAAYYFLRSKGGASTIRAAVEQDEKMFKATNWSSYLDTVSNDDWEMIYDQYKDRLKQVGIKSASKLAEEVKVRMKAVGDVNKVQSIEILDEHETDEGMKPGLEEDVTSDEFYFASKKLTAQWVKETGKDGETKDVKYYYYERNGKWYSGYVLKLAAESAKEFADAGRDTDLESAEKIADAVKKALESKKAKKQLVKYKDGVTIMARPGKKFAVTGKAKVDIYVALVNEYLVNEYNEVAPRIRHTETTLGWTIKSWAVVLDEEGNPVVYVTDGTMDNKMELYPNADANY